MVWSSLAGVLSSGCGSEPPPPEPDEIKVGLLVPFTGGSSTVGFNYEHGVRYALEQAGPINGHDVRLIAADTHSDVNRAIAAAKDLVDQGVVAILGPENAEAATALLPILRAANVVLLSPFIGESATVDLPPESPWFRIAPAVTAMADTMALNITDKGIKDIAVVSSPDDYNTAFATELAARFKALGGTVKVKVTLSATSSYSDAAAQVVGAGPGAVALLTVPTTAADFVTESAVYAPNTHQQWFLSPLLDTDVFVLNTIPSSLEGAVGITPHIFESRAGFAEVFGKRWAGDVPLDGTMFYYDTTALIALSLQAASVADGGLSYTTLRDAILTIGFTSGRRFGWQDIREGVKELSQQGHDAYYAGLTGPMSLDPSGRNRYNKSEPWSISNGRIVNVGAN